MPTLQSFPLLAGNLGLFAGFNVVFSEPQHPWYRSEAFSIQLMSHDVLRVSGGDIFLACSLVLLFIEVLRSTKGGGEPLINHAFSVLVFVTAFVLFLMQPGYGNSTFLLFTSTALFDFLAGFIITAVTSRRDVSFNRA